jgi:hypothetical protein
MLRPGMSADRKTIMSDTSSDTALAIVEIDYIEVDMTRAERRACSACDDARGRLDAALEAVAPVLREVGLRPRVRSLKVTTAAEAELLRLRGSPTIRIGGREIVPEHGDPAGEARAWTWRGRHHDLPPKAMSTEALLALAGTAQTDLRGAYVLPDYLRRFVDASAAA